MANTKVEFLIKAPKEKELYVVGNVPALGDWNPEKGMKLTFCEECSCYTGSKLLPVDSNIEFKVVAGKDWNGVEKGQWGEEVSNHAFVAVKGTKVEVVVASF